MKQTRYQKQHLAWLLTFKKALSHLFKADVDRIMAAASEEEVGTIAADLFHLAIRQGRFYHGEDIKDELSTLEDDYGREVPYASTFALPFAQMMAGCLPSFVAETVEQQCRLFEKQFDFFRVADSGYGYLLEVLEEERLRQEVAATPSLDRAIAWLSCRMEEAESRLPVVALAAATPAPAPVALTTADQWQAVLTGGYTWPQLENLLTQLGLLEGTSKLPTPELKPGAWVGTVAALQAKKYLTLNSAAIARAIESTFGKLVNQRTLQNGRREDHATHNQYYNRSLSVLNRQEN